MQRENPIILDERAQFLLGCARTYTSQFGEDGLIEATFKKIRTTNKWCFEVGAGDGIALSNTKALRDNGWNAVLIEADETLFDKLKDQYRPGVIAVHATIKPESLDQILNKCGAPYDLDFGSLDIDGQDYHCWDGMKLFNPRLMLVEYSPYGPNPENFIPEVGGEGQAGVNAIIDLGRSKGYFPMCQTYCNVLFCREDAWESN